jgi:RHS repeat-associated protein
MPGRKLSGGYRYGFNGKENDNEVKGDGNQQDYGMRIYDGRIGKFLSVDPLAHKLPSWSPYSAMACNPILNIDVDGLFPWPITARSFISAKTVGGGYFRGDGRGPSLSTDRTVATSRTFVNFIFDPQKQKIVNPTVDADPTVVYVPELGMGDLYPIYSEDPKPKASFSPVTTTKNSLGNNIGSFGFNYSAKDPVTPSLFTPELDVQSNFSITENLETGTLFVNATFTGDVFPSTEAFITDQSGAKLFLGARKETGGVSDLFGNNQKFLFTVDMQIKFDKKGNFTGVHQGDKLINVADWNKQVESKFEKK